MGEAMDKGRVEEMRRWGGGGDGGGGGGDGRRGRRREGGAGRRGREEKFGHQPHEPTSCPGPSIIPGVAGGASARTHALVPEATPVPRLGTAVSDSFCGGSLYAPQPSLLAVLLCLRSTLPGKEKDTR